MADNAIYGTEGDDYIDGTFIDDDLETVEEVYTIYLGAGVMTISN